MSLSSILHLIFKLKFKVKYSTLHRNPITQQSSRFPGYSHLKSTVCASDMPASGFFPWQLCPWGQFTWVSMSTVSEHSVFIQQLNSEAVRERFLKEDTHKYLSPWTDVYLGLPLRLQTWIYPVAACLWKKSLISIRLREELSFFKYSIDWHICLLAMEKEPNINSHCWFTGHGRLLRCFYTWEHMHDQFTVRPSTKRQQIVAKPLSGTVLE